MPNTGPDSAPLVHVAVAVIRRGSQVLVARRPDHLHQGGLLEFPGGKVEPGESVQTALIREIAEETGLKLDPGSLRPLIGIRHDYGDKRVFLDVWQTFSAVGAPQGLEGQWVDWCELASLREAEFPAANRAIIRALTLPLTYFITGACASVEDGVARLQRQLDRYRPSMVLLRAPWLTPGDYLRFATTASALCQHHHVRLILHGEPAVLGKVVADGIHLPWHLASTLTERPVPWDCLLAVSCHDQSQLAHAAHLDADFVTLGPVRPTASHPGAPVLDWPGFGALSALATMPVYGLGGLTPADQTVAVEHGAQGVAGIGCWW